MIKILEEGKYLGQSLRSCSGIINLAKKVGNDRVENASKRALEYGQHSFTIVRTILERGLDKFTDEEQGDIDLPDHKNIRGNQYYK